MPRNLLLKGGTLSLFCMGQEVLTGRSVCLPLAIHKHSATAGKAIGWAQPCALMGTFAVVFGNKSNHLLSAFLTNTTDSVICASTIPSCCFDLLIGLCCKKNPMCASFSFFFFPFFMELTVRCYFVPRETARTWSLLDSRRKDLQGSQWENWLLWKEGDLVEFKTALQAVCLSDVSWQFHWINWSNVDL